MRKNVWLIAIVIGAVNAVVLYVFEFIGIEVTDWLWNDLLATDIHRSRVVPAAILLGLILTGLIRLLHDKRIVPIDETLRDDMDRAPSTLSAIGKVMVIGAMSLLAGGSIGPEASLMIASVGIGSYAAVRSKQDPLRQTLMLASIGALLVAFIGSLILMLVPLLILFDQAKKLKQRPQIKAIFIIIIASIASLVTLEFINHLTGESGGYGSLPTMPAFQAKDFAIAIAFGFVSGFLALCLTKLIRQFWRFASWLDSRKLPARDWLVGLFFSTLLGFLYLLGGESIQFSGSTGSHILVSEAAQYGILALMWLITTKLLATAWSKATGYRGGLVFPSIYVGVALGLLAGQLVNGLSGAGAMIGGISGMITAAVGSPIVAGIFLIAILPWPLWPVGLCAIIGTLLFSKLRSDKDSETIKQT